MHLVRWESPASLLWRALELFCLSHCPLSFVPSGHHSPEKSRAWLLPGLRPSRAPPERRCPSQVPPERRCPSQVPPERRCPSQAPPERRYPSQAPPGHQNCKRRKLSRRRATLADKFPPTTASSTRDHATQPNTVKPYGGDCSPAQTGPAFANIHSPNTRAIRAGKPLGERSRS
jgi:hypothetical protein